MRIAEVIARAMHAHIDAICVAEGVAPMPWEEVPEDHRNDLVEVGEAVRAALAESGVLTDVLVEQAAKVLDQRALNEQNRSEQHKATGKHYKAREAAHVARIAKEDAARIRALLEPGC